MVKKAKKCGKEVTINMENAIIDAMWISDEFRIQYSGYNIEQALFELKCRGCPDLMF